MIRQKKKKKLKKERKTEIKNEDTRRKIGEAIANTKPERRKQKDEGQCTAMIR